MPNYHAYESILSQEKLSLEDKFVELYLTGLKPPHIIFLLGISETVAAKIFSKVKNQLPDDELNFVFYDDSFEQQVQKQQDEALRTIIKAKTGVDQEVKSRFGPISLYKLGMDGLKMSIYAISYEEGRKRDMRKFMFHFNNALTHNPKYTRALIGIGFCYSILGYHSAAFEVFSYAEQLNKTLFTHEFFPTYHSIILRMNQPEDFLEVEDVDVVSKEFQQRVREHHSKKVKEKGTAREPIPFHMTGLALARGLEYSMKEPEFMLDGNLPPGITHLSLSEFHIQLDKLVQIATCTKTDLSNEEKIDILLKQDLDPILVPPLLGLSEQEVLSLMKEYQGKLKSYDNEYLDLLHNRLFGTARTLAQHFGSNYTPEHFCNMGWQRFLDLAKKESNATQEDSHFPVFDFINALLINPRHVEAFVGIAVVILAHSLNRLTDIEWLAKAYKIKPYETVNIILQKYLVEDISQTLDKHVISG